MMDRRSVYPAECLDVHDNIIPSYAADRCFTAVRNGVSISVGFEESKPL